MRQEHVSRRSPFALAGAALLAVTIVIFLVPESLVELMQRSGALEGSQADWAYRLLSLAAVAQAAYGGFVVLRPERIGAELPPSVEDRAQTATTVARNAAGMTCLTIVYGVAAFALTGLRGGFWLFVAIAILQGAWYYRAVGIIETWVQRQPASEAARPPGAAGHDREAYCPPLARALIDSSRDVR